MPIHVDVALPDSSVEQVQQLQELLEMPQVQVIFFAIDRLADNRPIYAYHNPGGAIGVPSPAQKQLRSLVRQTEVTMSKRLGVTLPDSSARQLSELQEYLNMTQVQVLIVAIDRMANGELSKRIDDINRLPPASLRTTGEYVGTSESVTPDPVPEIGSELSHRFRYSWARLGMPPISDDDTE